MKIATYTLSSALVITAINTFAVYQYGKVVEPFVWSSSVGLAVCQLVLLACWVVWSESPMMEKFRWSYRLLLVQWLSFAFPCSLVSNEWPMPWCILADQAMVWTAALAGAGLVRVVVRRRISAGKPSVENRNASFGILDLLILTTVCAFFLAIVLRFQEEIAPGFLSGLQYTIMLIAGLWFGLPTGLLFAIYVAGFASNSQSFFLNWICSWLILFTLALLVLLVLLGSGMDEILFFGIPVALALSATTIIGCIFRGQGYRWAIQSLKLASVGETPAEADE